MLRNARHRVPALAFVAVAALAVGSLAACTDGSGQGIEEVRPQPTGMKTVARLDAVRPDGTATVSAQQREAARKTIADRLEAAGLPEVTVDIDGTQLVLTLDGQHSAEQIMRLVAPANLRFRKVLRTAPADAPGQGVTIPGPNATPSGAPATPPTPAGTAGSAGGRRGTALPSRAEVLAKVGSAAAALATTLTDPQQAADPRYTATLAPFGLLTAAEVAALPAAVQYALPQITCATLNRRPLAALAAVGDRIAACDTKATHRYLLDEATVSGADLAGAKASVDPTASVSWLVEITFNPAGQARWTALTREAHQNVGGDCPGPEPCQVAIVVDQQVVSAPQILGVITGPAQITGNFTAADARLLAGQLAAGALALELSVSSVDVQRPN